MITVEKFTKKEPVNLKYQGPGIFHYEKYQIYKDGMPVTSFTVSEAMQLRDELIRLIPQGLTLAGLFVKHVVGDKVVDDVNFRRNYA